MRIQVAALVLPLAIVVAASSAQAQDPGAVGVAMGYPSTVSLIWHATKSVAIRPEVAFVMSSVESTGTGTSSAITSDTSQIGAGVSALIYSGGKGPLRTYFSPRFAYNRVHTKTSSGSSSTATATGYTVTGSFGAQYALSNRFSAFGEVGAGYSTADNKSDTGGATSTGHSIGTRTAAGVIFYF